MIKVDSRVVFTSLFSLCIASHFWWPLLTNLLVMVITLFWLIDKKGSRLIKAFSSKWSYALGIPLLLTAISLFWTDNMVLGLFMVEKRLSLFVFPLLFSGLEKDELNQTWVIDTTWISLFFAALAGLLHSTLLVYTGKAGAEYFYSDLIAEPFIDQAIYMAFYINIVFVLMTYQIITKQGVLNRIKWLKFLVYPFFITIHFLLASRMSILILIVAFILFLVFWLFRRLSLKQSLVLVLSGGILIFSLISFFPKTLNRFKLINQFEFDYTNPNPLNHFNGPVNGKNWTGITARLAIWGSVFDNLDKLPLEGYGAGDVETALNDSFRTKEFKLGLDNNFNTHNQYLDYLLGYGYVGLLLFILGYGLTAFKAIKDKNWLYIAVLTVCLLSFLTENILNRNMGIMMTAFMLPFLFLNNARD